MACIREIKLFTVNETTVNTSYLIVQWIPRMKCFQELSTLLMLCVHRYILAVTRPWEKTGLIYTKYTCCITARISCSI